MFQGDVSFPLHYAVSGYALSILINNATYEYFLDFLQKKNNKNTDIENKN